MSQQSQTSIIGAGTIVLIVAIAVITALYFIQNNTQDKTAVQDTKPTIATTIFPLYDITKNIVGNHAKIILLIPSGASPHSYSLTPKQIISIQQAQALFAIGHGLDDSTVKSIAKITNISATIVDRQIQLHSYDEQSEQPTVKLLFNTDKNLIDPHYWLTVPNAKQIATTISNQMQTVDPLKAREYQQNLTAYLDQLDSLEEELQALSQDITQPAFITVHNSWTYFTEQYHLKTVGSYEPIEGREPSIKDIQRFKQTIKQYKLTTFFTEPQKPISSATTLFQNEFSLNIAELDPVGGGEENDSFIMLMRRNMHAIKNAK